MSGSTPTGSALIAAERQRQIESEGWTPEHDREHGPLRLRRAADCYAEVPAVGCVVRATPAFWPWEPRWWKPKGPLRNLVRAGALYQAALDMANPDQTATVTSPEALAYARDRCATAIDDLLSEAAELLTKPDVGQL
jgi:hypothetical protein